MKAPVSNPDFAEFRLCQEFKCLPSALGKEKARKIEKFTIFLAEIDKIAKEEQDKLKNQFGRWR